MPKAFDPYHQWLAIPPAEQPAHCYRLLGVALFEDDAGVIESAADRQMAHVRTFAAGLHAAEAQRILNEISLARITLLDPKRRAPYDTVLRQAAPADRTEEPPPPPAARPAQATASQPQAAPPQRLGHYQIVERIGGSALGIVYKACDVRDGRFFSLKILPPAAHTPEILKRFRRECDIMTRLDHPNLIAGIEAGEEQGMPYLVTEYVMGTDLNTVVQQHGPLSVEQARDYLAQAARGMMQLHFNGVFHRNLKPQVLLVDMAGKLRVTNLLLAKVAEGSEFDPGEQLTLMGQMVGSADYMAPEQATDPHDVNAAADIYSLGCTLHFLLTGRIPFGGKSLMEKLQAHRQAPVPSLQAARDDVPADLEKIYQRMMNKDRDARYQNLGELAADLERKPLRRQHGMSRNAIIAMAAAAAAIAILLAVLAVRW